MDAGGAGVALGCSALARRLPRGERHGLPAGPGLPRLERGDGLTRVAVGRGGDQDQVHVARARQLLAASERVRDGELGGHHAGPLQAAARDRRDRRPRHEPQGRELHPAGEPGTDDADPHAHIWKRHDTVSRPTGTASKAASTAMCVEVSVSVPVPRATSATALSARVTQTVPLSSGAPCAASPVTNPTPTVAPRGDSVSPRRGTGHAPVVTESRVRNHTTTPSPPFAPWSSRDRKSVV